MILARPVRGVAGRVSAIASSVMMMAASYCLRQILNIR
jgi:hypothetical protein